MKEHLQSHWLVQANIKSCKDHGVYCGACHIQCRKCTTEQSWNFDCSWDEIKRASLLGLEDWYEHKVAAERTRVRTGKTNRQLYPNDPF